MGVFPLLLTLPAPWELRLSLLGWVQVLAASCGSGRGESRGERWPRLQKGLTCHGTVSDRALRGWCCSVGRRERDTVPKLLHAALARAARCPAQRACWSAGPLHAGFPACQIVWKRISENKRVLACFGGREMLTKRIIWWRW